MFCVFSKINISIVSLVPGSYFSSLSAVMFMQHDYCKSHVKLTARGWDVARNIILSGPPHMYHVYGCLKESIFIGSEWFKHSGPIL